MATLETSAMILGTDFLINIFICCKIIYCRKKRQHDIDKSTELLQELVINEMIELVLPLGYLATLLIAFFGPNSELIDNIGSDYWQYTPIEDLDHTITCVLMFFFVDLGSLFASEILLWTFCRIKLHEAFIAIFAEFGIVFTIQIGYALSSVSKVKFYFLNDHSCNV